MRDFCCLLHHERWVGASGTCDLFKLESKFCWFSSTGCRSFINLKISSSKLNLDKGGQS